MGSTYHKITVNSYNNNISVIFRSFVRSFKCVVLINGNIGALIYAPKYSY